MQVRILPFGVLKDWLGSSPANVELREGATVSDLLEHLVQVAPGRPAAALRGIAVSVNAEYAASGHILRDGDEVGLLPPVSGGTAQSASPSVPALVALTRAPLDVGKLFSEAMVRKT